MPAFPENLVLIGCGNMAGSMLARWLACGLDAGRVLVVDPGRDAPPATGVRLLHELPDGVPPGSVMILGFKPQQLAAIAPGLRVLTPQVSLVISMLAGIETSILQEQLGPGVPLVRVMPNLPVSLGRGVCGLFAASVDPNIRAVVDGLMTPLGSVEWLGKESDFNLLTAVSGCGPAFLYRFIDVMASAAVSLGMEAELAQRLALATVDGAAGLAAIASEPPAVLADRVASPGGMTREGLDVMDHDNRMFQLMKDVLQAASDRGEALAAAAQREG